MVLTRLIQVKLSASAVSEAIQQMSQGVSSLAATLWVPADLCGGPWSQEIIRVRQAEFIRPKEIKIWLCEKRAQHQWGVQEKNSACP